VLIMIVEQLVHTDRLPSVQRRPNCGGSALAERGQPRGRSAWL